jgi:hypothetical protein
LPVLIALAAAGYFICAQFAAHSDAVWPMPLAVALLALALLLPGLARGRALAVLGLCAALVLLAACLVGGAARLPGYFVPPLLLGAASWFFGRTLVPASQPLIARIVSALDGADFAAQPAVARYALGLTRAWALGLAVLALAALALAFCVVPDGVIALSGNTPPLSLTPAQWSRCVNLGGYGSVSVAFAGEFLLRRWLLPQAPKRSFAAFARGVMKLWPELTRP